MHLHMPYTTPSLKVHTKKRISQIKKNVPLSFRSRRFRGVLLLGTKLKACARLARSRRLVHVWYGAEGSYPLSFRSRRFRGVLLSGTKPKACACFKHDVWYGAEGSHHFMHMCCPQRYDANYVQKTYVLSFNATQYQNP